jgi:hypothetical protein
LGSKRHSISYVILQIERLTGLQESLGGIPILENYFLYSENAVTKDVNKILI